MKKNSLSTSEKNNLTIYLIGEGKIQIKINDKIIFNKKIENDKQFPESIGVEIKPEKNIISVDAGKIKIKKEFYCDKEKDYWAKIWYDSAYKKIKIDVEDQPIMFW